jgi:YD repeat-containing protein
MGQVNIASPNAASLGKFGDIPVSYHTGIPSINIPIYTVKSGPLELPVGLSYHASGLKVQEQASWVGAGWALNAGGVITHSVIGVSDDRGFSSTNTLKGHFSDYGYNSYLFGAGPSVCTPVGGNGPLICPVGANYPPQDAFLQSGVFDGEPDLYFFNFNGYSGKFYFNDDRTPVMMPEQDLQITPIYPGTDWRGIIGFIITTPDGTQYYFGQNQNGDGNPDAIELTYNITTQNNSYTGQGATSSWFLNRIVSADKQFTITLSYQLENYSYFTLAMYPIPAARNPNIFAYNSEYDLDKNFISGVRLSKISFINGEIDFNPGSLRQDMGYGNNNTTLNDIPNTDTVLGARTLGSISIKSGNYCKKDSFYFSYFYDSNPLTGILFTTTFPNLNLQTDQYRLRLDSIAESSCDNTVHVPPYKFVYNSGVVPRKLSFGVDHWGFYNGINSNTELIPTYTVIPPLGSQGQATINDTIVAGADRDSHWPACLGGTIQKVTYPTGGSSQFNFEANGVYAQTSSYINATLVNMLYGLYGQAADTVRSNFTVDTSTSSVTMVITSTSNYSATFSIYDVNNNTVFSTNMSNWNGTGTNVTFKETISLSPGAYHAVLSPYSITNLTGGVQAILTQYQNVKSLTTLQVGGVRIQSIVNNDGINPANTTTSYGYNYNNNPYGKSSGILYSQPIYVSAIRNDVWGIVNGAMCSPYGCLTCFGSNVSYYQSPSSIRPMASSQGNHIGYGQVYVTQSGNGSTLYKYYSTNGAITDSTLAPVQDVCVRSINLGCSQAIANSPAPPLPFDPIRGELAFQASYNQNGQILKSETYLPQYQFDSLLTPGIISKFFITGYMPANSSPTAFNAADVTDASLPSLPVGITSIPIGVTTFTEYNLQSAKKIRDSIISLVYDLNTGNAITSISATYFNSLYHNSPTQKISYSSKGELLSTNIKSAFDFRISNFSAVDSLVVLYNAIKNDSLYLNNAINALPSTLLPSDPNYYWQRLNIFTNFRYTKAVARQNYIAYRLRNFTGAGNVYSVAHTAAESGADTLLKPILVLQDNFINTPIEETQWRNNKLTGAAYTGYGFVTSPAGFAYPVKEQKINLLSPSFNFSPAIVAGSSINKDSRYQDESYYSYTTGNITGVTNRDGVITSYLWGYGNQYPVAKITGANYNTAISYVNNSVLQSPGSDALLRAQLANIALNLPSAFVTYYTYQPLVGMTSQTNPNGRPTYYQYDALGRLLLVQDQDLNIIKTYKYNYKR